MESVTTALDHAGIGPSAFRTSSPTTWPPRKTPDESPRTSTPTRSGSSSPAPCTTSSSPARPSPGPTDHLMRYIAAAAEAIAATPPQNAEDTMTHTFNRTPYNGTGSSWRRTVLIVIAVVLAAALALVLHVMGVLPPG